MNFEDHYKKFISTLASAIWYFFFQVRTVLSARARPDSWVHHLAASVAESWSKAYFATFSLVSSSQTW